MALLVFYNSGYATQQWMQEQEDNLNYVAVTRAMQELVLMDIPKS